MTTKADFDVRSLSDADLVRFAQAAQVEIAARERKRKEDAIAKIRALAGEAGLSVAIEGARGRPGGKLPNKSGRKAPHPAKAGATP
ncbi:MAG: hypothetical protein KIT17_01015 [Rubrivivax sp.]|nr:hypothetical protein [Rubrivivax sp.]